MYLLTVGNGSLAQGIQNNCRFQMVPHGTATKPEDFNRKAVKNTVVFFVGSERLLKDAFSYCIENDFVFVQAASGMNEKMPETKLCPIILAPNLNLNVVAAMSVLPSLNAKLKELGMVAKLKESHQRSKKTPPGTAFQIAEMIGVEKRNIVSIRDENEQLEIGVTKEHLGGHAFHFIEFFSGTTRIEINIKVSGRDDYALGAIEVARKICVNRSSLDNEIYTLEYILSL